MYNYKNIDEFIKFAKIDNKYLNTAVDRCINSFVIKYEQNLNNINLDKMFEDFKNNYINPAINILALSSIYSDYKKFNNISKAINYTKSNDGIGLFVNTLLKLIQTVINNRFKNKKLYELFLKVNNEIMIEFNWNNIADNCISDIFNNQEKYKLYNDIYPQFEELNNIL
jgi:hypothetical protein